MLVFDSNNFDELIKTEIYEFDELVQAIMHFENTLDLKTIKKAYQFAQHAHLGQKRESGQEYIIHPLNVAFILAQHGCDLETIVAGILHDVVEDTDATIEDIKREFGDNVAELVKGVTNITKRGNETLYENLSKDDKNAANLKEIFLCATTDIRIIFIKLADRLHNIRTLEYKSDVQKRKLKAIETIDIYAPLAKIFGMYRLCTELQDLSLKYLYEREYKDITYEVDSYVKARQSVLDEMQGTLDKLMRDKNIPVNVNQEVNHIYSIFRKKRKYGDNFSYAEMHDLIRFKVIIDDIDYKFNYEEIVYKCFETMCTIHRTFKPFNTDGVKDFINNPKANNYQSLNTTVYAPTGFLVQAHIRAKTMSDIASRGLPKMLMNSHVYTNLGRQKEELVQKFVKAVTEVLGINSNQEISNKEFVSTLISDFLTKYIYVFDRSGKKVELPFESTPIDFAYNLHTDVGDKMIGGLINGVPMTEDDFAKPLKSGDCVNIYTSDDAKPLDLKYVDLVRTERAKKYIKRANGIIKKEL